LLLIEESSHRTALAFAVGVFIGFSPFWGLHTGLGILAALVFGFNRVAVLAGVWVNTPWTMPPAASIGTALGLVLLGMDVGFPSIPEVSITSGEFWTTAVVEFEHLLVPFFVGNIVFSLLAAGVAYFILRWILVKNRNRRMSHSSPGTT
jgi:uncharacterized protein (DUF2062 family)